MATALLSVSVATTSQFTVGRVRLGSAGRPSPGVGWSAGMDADSKSDQQRAENNDTSSGAVPVGQVLFKSAR